MNDDNLHSNIDDLSRGWSAVSVSFPLCFTMVSKTLSLLYAEHRAAGLRAPINHHSALPVRMRPCTYYLKIREGNPSRATRNFKVTLKYPWKLVFGFLFFFSQNYVNRR